MKYIITITKCEYDWQIPLARSTDVFRQIVEDIDIKDVAVRLNEPRAGQYYVYDWSKIDPYKVTSTMDGII